MKQLWKWSVSQPSAPEMRDKLVMTLCCRSISAHQFYSMFVFQSDHEKGTLSAKEPSESLVLCLFIEAVMALKTASDRLSWGQTLVQTSAENHCFSVALSSCSTNTPCDGRRGFLCCLREVFYLSTQKKSCITNEYNDRWSCWCNMMLCLHKWIMEGSTDTPSLWIY